MTAASPTLLALDGVVITAAQAQSGLTALVAAMPQIVQALQSRLASLPADANVAEEIVTIAGDLGLPDAAIIVAVIKAGMLVESYIVSPPNHGVLGALADSLKGVVRPVANADGSEL